MTLSVDKPSKNMTNDPGHKSYLPMSGSFFFEWEGVVARDDSDGARELKFRERLHADDAASISRHSFIILLLVLMLWHSTLSTSSTTNVFLCMLQSLEYYLLDEPSLLKEDEQNLLLLSETLVYQYRSSS